MPEQWTSERNGWYLTFNKRLDLSAYPEGQRQHAALTHSSALFAQFKSLLPPGVRMVYKKLLFARLVGPHDQCAMLKEKLEELGLANMWPNDARLKAIE